MYCIIKKMGIFTRKTKEKYVIDYRSKKREEDKLMWNRFMETAEVVDITQSGIQIAKPKIIIPDTNVLSNSELYFGEIYDMVKEMTCKKIAEKQRILERNSVIKIKRRET